MRQESNVQLKKICGHHCGRLVLKVFWKKSASPWLRGCLLARCLLHAWPATIWSVTVFEKKSCTPTDPKSYQKNNNKNDRRNPANHLGCTKKHVNNGMFTISTGAVLPSTVFYQQKIWYIPNRSILLQPSHSKDLGHPLSTPIAAMQHVLGPAPVFGGNGTKKDQKFSTCCFNYFKYIHSDNFFELRCMHLLSWITLKHGCCWRFRKVPWQFKEKGA